MQRAEVLCLDKIIGGCKNIIPDVVQIGEDKKELINLWVSNSQEIECLIDTTTKLLHTQAFSKLIELTVESMECMEFLCCGPPPLELFVRLEELRMIKCFQLRGILSAGNLNLSSLKVLKLYDCPRLVSLFTPAVAQTLVQLEVLQVERCNGLRCIVADGEDKKEEIVSLEQNSRGLEFRKLKNIKISNCKQLEYVFDQYNHEDQTSNPNRKEAIKIIEFPVLNELSLEQLPNMVGFFPERYIMKWPALHEFFVQNCPKLIMGAINNCTVGTELRQQGNSTTKDDAVFIENLESLLVKNTIVESIFNLDGLSTDKEHVISGLRSVDLYLLPELRYICMGPKHFLSLQNLTKLQIEGCEKLKFVFSTLIIRSFSNLRTLELVNCQELVQITEEDVENQDQLSNHGFQDVCFPKLIILFVSNCNKLKRLFSISTSYEFLKLKSLIIMGASELEEVFGWEKGEKYDDVELVLPNLKHLVLTELPSLVNVSQGIQLKDVDYHFVHDCPKLGLTSNMSLEDVCQKFNDERGKEIADYEFELYWKLSEILASISYKEDCTLETASHHQMDPNDQDSVESSPDSGYNQHDSGIALIASPNLIEKMKETVGNVPALEILGVETSSTDSELTRPSLSPLVVPLHEAPSPSNKEIMEQSAQEPKNPSLELMVKQSRNEAMITNQKALEETGTDIYFNNSQNVKPASSCLPKSLISQEKSTYLSFNDVQSIKASVQESSILQKASVVTFETHDSESGSSTPKLLVSSPCGKPLKELVEKGSNESTSMEALEETHETPQKPDKPPNLPQKTSLQSIKASAQSGSPANIVASSTNLEPGTSINSQIELVDESMGAQMTMEQGAVGQSEISHEFPQIVDKPSDSGLVQNVEEHASASTFETKSNKSAMARSLTVPKLKESDLTPNVTSPQKSSPLGQIKLHHTETSNQEDVEASAMNQHDFNDDDLICLLQSMEDDNDISVPVPSVSRIPAVHPFLKDKQLAQAIADLEASLKMPLNNIADSENRIIHLEKTLKFLSSHCWEDGSLPDRLKATIDTLHQDFPIILSSYKKASTTIDKFKELEEKEKSIKEKHPQQMEAAKPLVSGILKTKKTMAEAQQNEKYLKEQISRLQVELENTEQKIKDCKVSLLSLEEQKKQFHENAMGLKNELETLKKERSEMSEDQRKAWRELVKVDNKWLALCDQFADNLIAARNLS